MEESHAPQAQGDPPQPEADSLGHSRDPLVILERVSEAVNAFDDLDMVLHSALAGTLAALAQGVAERPGGLGGAVEAGIVYLLDEASGMFTPAVWQGLEPATLSEAGSFRPGEGPAGLAAASRGPVIVADLCEEPLKISASVLSRGWRSLVSVPLTARGQVLGVISLCSLLPARYTAADARLLMGISKPVAAAIQNARRFGELAARGDEARLLRELNEGIVQSVAEAIILEDREGHIRFANPAAGRLLGWPSAELVGHHWAEVVVAEEIAGIEARMHDRQLGHSDRYETVLRARDGSSIPVMVRVRPFIESGRFAGTLDALTDLRELRAQQEATREAQAQREAALAQREAALAERENALRDLAGREAELQARDAERATLYETLLAITMPHELPELLQAIVEHAVGLLRGSSGVLWLADPERREVRGVVNHLAPHNPIGMVLPYGEGAAGVAAATGRPLIVNDYRRWSARAHVLEETRPYAAALCAPMRWQGRLIGVIDVFHHEEGSAFTTADLELLAAFADQAAIAVGNARLLEAERTQRAQAEALRDTAAALASTFDFDALLERILELAARVVPCDAATIMLIEDGMARPARWRGYHKQGAAEAAAVPLPVVSTANLRQVVETGRVLAIPDTQGYPGWQALPGLEWIGSVICAPIRSKGQIAGFLNLSCEQPGSLTAEYAQALQAFADQAALALDNARLLAAERAQRAQAEALRDTAEALASTLDFDEVLERILEQAARVVPYDSGAVLLIKDGIAYALHSRGYAERGAEAALAGLRLPVADTPNLRQMMQTGRVCLVSDTRSDPRWVTLPGLEWLGSSISAPIRSRGQIIGFLALESEQRGFMTDAYAGPLQAFADQAAITVDNARLLQAERTQRAQAEALRDTAEALASTLAFDDVLERILEQAARVVPYDAATIMLIEEGIARVVRSLGYDQRGLGAEVLAVRLRVDDLANLR